MRRRTSRSLKGLGAGSAEQVGDPAGLGTADTVLATEREVKSVTLAGAGAYDASYFTRLYGGLQADGHPSQTILDRLRDLRISQLLERHAPRAQPRALLDIGCGFGWMLDRAGDSFECYGLDISGHAIARARKVVGSATVTAADIEDGIPFEREFEAILAVNVLEHLRHPAAAIGRMFDRLVRGGVAIVHLPTIDNRITRALYDATYDSDPTHIYRPSSQEVRELFQERGFDLVTHSRCPHIAAPLWHAISWHPAYLAVFRRP